MRKIHQNDDYEVINSTIDGYIKPHLHIDNKKGKKRRAKFVVSVSPEERFAPDVKNGLTDEQVQKRISQNQVNLRNRQSSRSSAKIIASNLLTFFNFLFHIGSLLINNVVLVLGVQQSVSVLHIHVSIPFQILFQLGCYIILSRVPCPIQ